MDGSRKCFVLPDELDGFKTEVMHNLAQKQQNCEVGACNWRIQFRGRRTHNYTCVAAEKIFYTLAGIRIGWYSFLRNSSIRSFSEDTSCSLVFNIANRIIGFCIGRNFLLKKNCRQGTGSRFPV